MVEMLLDYGWEATEACIQAAVKSPVILRKLLEDAAAGGADYLALELPPALVISAMYRAAVVYYERASQVVRMRSAHVLLEHLLQRPGVHAWLMKVYAGYKGDEGDAAPTEVSTEHKYIHTPSQYECTHKHTIPQQSPFVYSAASRPGPPA